MTHLLQTLNNYSLKPMAEFIVDILSRIGKMWVSALEAEGLKRAQAELLKYRSYRETYDQLMKLSDRELKDLGISRGMIHSIALEAYTDNLFKK